MATVLIVEDERPIRELLEALLRAAGYRTTVAVHGAEALARVAEEPPDLVLSDVMMPVLGGVELCRRLKAGPTTRGIPVILMSALRSAASVAAGQDAFLAKPFDIAQVETLVGRYARPGTDTARE